MAQLSQVKSINLPAALWDEIKGHCKRKLAGDFFEGETPVRRAYGMLAGDIRKDIAIVRKVIIFKINARTVEPLKSYMDDVMGRYATPSTTPLEQRGWITDPEELMASYELCDRQGLTVFGTYHMHIVPWDHDPVRDKPTRLDTVLAQDSGLFMFIISLVDESRPMIRAFMEGDPQREVPIILEADS